MSQPIRVSDAAAICGVPEAKVWAGISDNRIPRYGPGVGKVKLSDVFNAVGGDQCPTCGHREQPDLPAEEKKP